MQLRTEQLDGEAVGVGEVDFGIALDCRQPRQMRLLRGALLFVGAESPAALPRHLAALCRAGVLDLPEQHETDEGRQYDAVRHWLCGHPGWLLIVDNVDSEDAAAAAEALLPRLAGGGSPPAAAGGS